MGTSLINRMAIKKDGVYFSSRSSNVRDRYRSFRSSYYTDIYIKEGRKGLDREIIRSLYNFAAIRGHHKSVERYRYATESQKAHDIYKRYIDQINDYYNNKLDISDRDSIWRNPTEMAKKYFAFTNDKEDEMYTEMAELCLEYDKMQEQLNKISK